MRDYHEYFEKKVWAEPCSSVAEKIIRLTEAYSFVCFDSTHDPTCLEKKCVECHSNLHCVR